MGSAPGAVMLGIGVGSASGVESLGTNSRVTMSAATAMAKTTSAFTNHGVRRRRRRTGGRQRRFGEGRLARDLAARTRSSRTIDTISTVSVAVDIHDLRRASSHSAPKRSGKHLASFVEPVGGLAKRTIGGTSKCGE